MYWYLVVMGVWTQSACPRTLLQSHFTFLPATIIRHLSPDTQSDRNCRLLQNLWNSMGHIHDKLLAQVTQCKQVFVIFNADQFQALIFQNCMQFVDAANCWCCKGVRGWTIRATHTYTHNAFGFLVFGRSNVVYVQRVQFTSLMRKKVEKKA